MKITTDQFSWQRIIPASAFVKLLILWLPFLMILIISGLQNTVPVYILTRDIFAAAKVPMYTGLISNIGVFAWCCSCAVALFTYFVLKPTTGYEKKLKNFVGLSGAIAVMMFIDDFFMLHEEIFPQWLGIPEKVVLLAQMGLVVFYLIYFRNIILKATLFPLLVLSLLLFSMSILADFLPIEVDYKGFGSNLYFLFEDGTKLMGIVTWLYYICTVCKDIILQSKSRLSLYHE